ncbi:MAG: short-chain dehydrogenase [Sphingobacteriales bacterium 50-39]|nr:SDR family oxidoreductase [Sphingobacteriales bacterium]OJW60775.1 MAG: short-chain dehydrogenase [Sphingobacteriales bacterium 50-39]
MNISNKIILITGASRGIGRALVEEALKRGAKKVYAGTRRTFTHPDPRVVPLMLDVTDPEQIREAVSEVTSLDILINNAGIAYYDDLSDRSMIDKHLAVNLFGTYALSRAFLPALIRSHGAIVNNLSVVALASLPPIASYSISKAAAFSLTQSLRAFLAGQGVRVHAVLTGPTDTDMTKGFDIPKSAPQVIAQGVFDGVEKGVDDIFPDPMSGSVEESWVGSVMKQMERQNASLVAAQSN